MKKEEALKFIEEKGDTSYVVRTEADDKTFLENYGKSVLEKELDPAVSKIHSQYDDDLNELFGERKKPGEKTYKFMKDKFNTLKAKADRVDQLETEVESLKKGSPEVEAKLREIKSLQGQIDKLRQEYEGKMTEMSRQNLRDAIGGDFEGAFNKFKFKEGVPDYLLRMQLKEIVNELSQHAERRDGKIVYLDKEGKAIRTEDYKEATAETLLRDRMKDVIDAGRRQEGPEIGDPLPKDDKGDLNIIMPRHITSRERLGKYLVEELGIKRHTKEFLDAYEKYGKNLPSVDKRK